MIGDIKTKSKATLIGDILTKSVLGDVEVGKVVIKHDEADDYEGEYTITPSGESQILETANKKLADDVEIKAIPYYDVANEYGRTIYIGGEI